MNYQEILNYLFEATPMFQQVGHVAYKPGLMNTEALDALFNHPHRNFKTIHIGGTNGKGSCSHTIAAILQSAGYKVGLYTSPHLVDFSERIRVNGEPIDKDYVVNFVEKYKDQFEPLYPSFFELTTGMAFSYFADQKVDVAIIEVGLGGRLDCTNIISPDLTVITNISFDHVQYLGDTLEKIAGEKAGIIKKDTPVIIGEVLEETRPVFLNKAKEVGAPIVFAQENPEVTISELEDGWFYLTKSYGQFHGELGGYCQMMNTNTVLCAMNELIKLNYRISLKDVWNGFGNVCELTGLQGRWQKLSDEPRIICDTGHNTGGIKYIAEQLRSESYKNLHMVIGMVDDKDISGVLALLPKDATYYFTKASVKRAMNANDLQKKGADAGLKGNAYETVIEAVNSAIQKSLPEDLIFVGGSTFVVADLLANRDALDLN